MLRLLDRTVISENKFTPFSSQTGSSRLMNSNNNPSETFERGRGNFRFRQRFGNGNPTLDENGKEVAKSSVIQNAQYTLQVGYERTLIGRENPVHKDNYFRYGHIGAFEKALNPTFGPERDSSGTQVGWMHTGYNEAFVSYTPAGTNQGLVNYNNVVEDANAFEDFVVVNGQYF